MDKSDNIDINKINGLSRLKRIEIATKIEQRINKEIGEYNITKNGEYQKVCQEVADEYGITRNEAVYIYTGWDAYQKTSK